MSHSYEEIREVVILILLKRIHVSFQPEQWANLKLGVAEVFARREQKPGENINHVSGSGLDRRDAELTRDVFWDLFRQGFITLGLDDSNAQWPFFRLSHFGQEALNTGSPFLFHDTNSFLKLVRAEIPDLSSPATTYLSEACAAFYAGCLLSSCVMLGVAAEAEFLELVDVAIKNTSHGQKFSSVEKVTFIAQKISKFQACILPLAKQLPKEATEDLETNFLAIQSVLRIARNDAGHPTGSTPSRENVYIYLQLFVPFARQLMRLRQALS